MIDNGHTIQMTYEPGSSLVMAGAEFKLVQFHFHAPSEHTLNGRHLPLEIHLVHTGPDGAPALVVGVLVKSGRANEALEVTFRNLPHREGQTSEPAGAMIDAAALLPQNHAVFGYTGSLTTPPCTEGVQWRVFRESIEMSPKQISAYTSVSGLRRTARPLQPLGDRTVELDLTP
jgi:carbonic anhydrase